MPKAYNYTFRRLVRRDRLAGVAAARVAPVDYSGILKADLVALAEQRGLDSSGTKAELIERLSDG